MDNVKLITNTACPICKTGRMKFIRLVVNRIDYGNGNKFLVFKCNKCKHEIDRPYMVNSNKQLNFNCEVTS